MGDCGFRRCLAAFGGPARRVRARRHGGGVARPRARGPFSSCAGSGRRVTLFVAPSLVSLPEVSALLCFLLILLVPFAGVGLALINCGLGRARSAAHAMLAALSVTAVAAIVYVIVGFAWQGAAGRPEHVLIAGGKAWGWIAAEPFFLRGLRLDLSPAALVVLLQLFSVGPGGADSTQFGRGPLAAGRDVRLDCTARRLHLSAVRTLGMGRRMAGATRCQLRTRPGLPRRRGLRHDSSDWAD